jgi:uncharacterized integral membrane protein (TIGR00698 family)
MRDRRLQRAIECGDAGRMSIDVREETAPRQSTTRYGLLPGLGFAAAGVVAAMVVHQLVSQIGVLTWAVLLGAAAANMGLVPTVARPGLKIATKKLLRIGVVLLGLSLSLLSIISLGAPVIGLVVVTLFTTLLATNWLGWRMGLGGPRSLLIATGFAICGASAIAAMEENAEADEDDVAVAIAMVTICGTIAMIAVPLMQGPLGLTDTQLGAWAGASVHEVGQVVGAAGPAGATAVAVAVVVKLTRVLLLAPVVAGVSVLRRRRQRAEWAQNASDGGDVAAAKLPPLVPVFVIGFLACVLLRSSGVLPAGFLEVAGWLQTVTLGAALFGMGTGVHLKSLVRSSGQALGLAAISTVVIASVSLAGVTLLL